MNVEQTSEIQQAFVAQLARQIEDTVQLLREHELMQIEHAELQEHVKKLKDKAEYSDSLLDELSRLQRLSIRYTETFRKASELEEENKTLRTELDASRTELDALKNAQNEHAQSRNNDTEQLVQAKEKVAEQAQEIAKLTRWLLTAEERLAAKTGTVSGGKRVTDLTFAEQLACIRECRWFDADWYLQTYPDVAKAGIDPAEHYLRHGGFENRNPSQYFDSKWYLNQYPDVRKSGLNPLLHYVTSGQHEGCQPTAKGDVHG